jgi:MFS family permease
VAEIPPRSQYAHQFSLYNAINFQITLGAPMIIYAKTLGASSTTIGIVAALAPLMTVLQLPGAYFIPKIGYKGFVLLGWFSRTFIVFSLAFLPLVTLFDNTTKTSVLLLCLFIFNVLRGVSTGAWLPWLTSLVPEEARGEFLRRDQLHMQLGGVVALAVSSAVLWANPRNWQFTLLFVLSAAAGSLSLYFIRLIPDVEIGEQARGSGQPVPWLEILRYPPFRKLLFFNVVYNWVIGGIGAFVIGYLKSNGGFFDGEILICGLMSFVGAFASLPLFGRLLERTGSKPILRIALVCYLWAVLCWLMVASTLLEPSPLIIGVIYFIMGVAGGLFSIANTKIAMDTMPLMGRNHFFSLFTVFASLSLGLSPICWGIMLDVVGEWHVKLGPLSINRYSIYFAILVFLVLWTLRLAKPLMEQRGQPLSLALREAVFYGRLRLLNRFLNR